MMSAVELRLLAVSLCLLGAFSPRTPVAADASTMSFFVTSRGIDGSGNLGGLAGADRHCQTLAAAVSAGDRTWRAYLSAAPDNARGVVNARDRIGIGPWLNFEGTLIARDLSELHSDVSRLGGLTALTENGTRPSAHDILTGSDPSGRLAFLKGFPATCSDWTSDVDRVAAVGHSDRIEVDSEHNKRFPRRWGSWNAEHFTQGCSAKRLQSTGGAGLFYCFAADVSKTPAPRLRAQTRSRTSFEHGLNVNHWLGSNLAPNIEPHSLYGENWFDEEDVAWIAAQGFDHVRIRVGGHYWITNQGELDHGKIARFDAALVWARKHGLGVVLCMDALPGYRTGVRGGEPPVDVSSPFTDDTTRADAAYLWWLVARHYMHEDDRLRFELLNAPDANSVEQMRIFNRAALAAIRRTSPRRVVYVTSRDMGLNSADEVELSDAYTALAVEFWEPRVFAFQADESLPVIAFPGKVPALDAFVNEDGVPTGGYSNIDLSVALIDARIEAFARRIAPQIGKHEIYVSQFGVYERADDASASQYIRAVRAAFQRHGLHWAIYDYHTGCAVRGKDGEPTRILKALALPKPKR